MDRRSFVARLLATPFAVWLLGKEVPAPAVPVDTGGTFVPPEVVDRIIRHQPRPIIEVETVDGVWQDIGIVLSDPCMVLGVMFRGANLSAVVPHKSYPPIIDKLVVAGHTHTVRITRGKTIYTLKNCHITTAHIPGTDNLQFKAVCGEPVESEHNPGPPRLNFLVDFE